MTNSASQGCVILCPGQGAQAVGMGRKWYESSAAAREVFAEADQMLAHTLGAKLSDLCFNGPADRLNQTDVSQPAIFVCSVASFRGWVEQRGLPTVAATAGLSLGEYTALHLAGAFDFVTGLKLVTVRGRLMQDAAIASEGSMVALIGADDAQAQQVCDKAAPAGSGLVLVCANFNAPGQIVLSGDAQACQNAAQVASEMGLRASPLVVAGAFHSPLMQPAADQMASQLTQATFEPPRLPVWSNVTAQPHNLKDGELLRRLLVQQIISPVRWSQTCQALVSQGLTGYHELGPGTVLKGLMRRIDRNTKVISHDEPSES